MQRLTDINITINGPAWVMRVLFQIMDVGHFLYAGLCPIPSPNLNASINVMWRAPPDNDRHAIEIIAR